MALDDVGAFHRFARLYDRCMYDADPVVLAAGLDRAERVVGFGATGPVTVAGGGANQSSRARPNPRR